MKRIDHGAEPLEQWRPGVMTRMLVSALNGAATLCAFEQFVDPGKGAPTHSHSVEEVLTVMAGTADVWVEQEHATLAAGQSVVVPAGRWHGFRNVGTTVLNIHAVLAAPYFEAIFDDRSETRRRWTSD